MPAIEIPESRTRLIWLLAPPAVWAAHFLLSYVTAALWCAKVAAAGGALGSARYAIALYTVVALAVLGLIGRHAGGALRDAGAATGDRDDAAARHGFVATTTLLLAGLSAIAILYAALAAALVGSCR